MTLAFLLLFITAAVLALLLWPVRAAKRFCAVTCVIFLLGAALLYGILGAPRILPLLDAHAQKMAEISRDIAHARTAIDADPNDLKSWVTLGQGFAETGQWKAAQNAFKRAVVLSGGNPALIMAYAKSMILADGGNVSDEAKTSLEMVLLQEPQHPEARYFMAVRLLQDGKQEEAMRTMKNLYRSLPADSPLKATIDRQIGR